MIVSSLLLMATAGMSCGAGDVSHIDVSLEFEGRLLSQHFTDIAGNGVQSLSIALRLPDGRRELRIFELTERGLSPTPVHVVPILEDVIAYGFGDVRSEPGSELIFLTRSGAWSYSLTRDGYRGNIERLVETDLLYDVPDSRSLPYWHYIMPASAGDHVLLPGAGSYSIWGPRAASQERDPQGPSYTELARFPAPRSTGQARDEVPESGRRASIGRGGVRIEMRTGSEVFLEDEGQAAALLSDEKSQPAPALTDVDGDGVRDLIAADHNELRVHLSRDGLIAGEATRVEAYPDYLLVDDAQVTLEFVDLNGDRWSDLLAVIEKESEGLANSEKRLLFLVNDGTRLLPAKPTQVMRFEAATLRRHLVDVNADGRPDLVLRKFEMPSMLEAVTGLEFKMTHMVFLAQKKGKALFARRPVLKHVQVFNENSVGEAIKNRVLEFDCSGDGIPDLVEIDLQGHIAIRRLKHESGFFSGDTWELDADPWKRLETRGTTLSLRVYDVNGDGLGDIISPGESSLTLFLSRRKH